MQVTSVNHSYEWRGDKKVVIEYTATKYDGSNTVRKTQKWFYEVHIYDKRGNLLKENHIGKTIDRKV